MLNRIPRMQLRKLTNGTPYGSRAPVDEGMLSRISRHPYTLPVGILAAVVGGYYYVTKEEAHNRSNAEAIRAKMEASRKA